MNNIKLKSGPIKALGQPVAAVLSGTVAYVLLAVVTVPFSQPLVAGSVLVAGLAAVGFTAKFTADTMIDIKKMMPSKETLSAAYGTVQDKFGTIRDSLPVIKLPSFSFDVKDSLTAAKDWVVGSFSAIKTKFGAMFKLNNAEAPGSTNVHGNVDITAAAAAPVNAAASVSADGLGMDV